MLSKKKPEQSLEVTLIRLLTLRLQKLEICKEGLCIQNVYLAF